MEEPGESTHEGGARAIAAAVGDVGDGLVAGGEAKRGLDKATTADEGSRPDAGGRGEIVDAHALEQPLDDRTLGQTTLVIEP